MPLEGQCGLEPGVHLVTVVQTRHGQVPLVWLRVVHRHLVLDAECKARGWNSPGMSLSAVGVPRHRGLKVVVLGVGARRVGRELWLGLAIEVDGDCLQVEGWGDVVSNNAAKFVEGVERVEC